MQTVEQVREALRKALPVTSLASLIRVAVEDSRKVLANREIRPDWSIWYRDGTEYAPCAVCFGGAVMLGTLAGCSRRPLSHFHSSRFASLFEPPQYAALFALDRARRGDLRGAYSALERWHLGDGSPVEDRDPFRDAVCELRRERRRRHTDVTAAPAYSEFKGREEFRLFLDSVCRLADELEALELEHNA